jgi:hypothetical protein
MVAFVLRRGLSARAERCRSAPRARGALVDHFQPVTDVRDGHQGLEGTPAHGTGIVGRCFGKARITTCVAEG